MIENSSDRIERLQREIEAEQRKIKSCHHIFGKAEYDPDTKMVAYGSKIVGHGSDIYTEPEGYDEKEVPRWSRKCTICGFKEYTNKQKPVIS